MYAVLYTHQLEPITVVTLSLPLWNLLTKGDRVVIPVIEAVNVRASPEDRGEKPLLRHVGIFAERLQYRDSETLMLFTADEENALLLKSEFLPGQRYELNKRVMDGFAAGFTAALLTFGE
jgi:hypothetical protein